MKKVSKAVFPVGGMGTRFLPATKSIPKELLPIIDKPLIQYAVEEAIEAGINTLIFITSASKHAISDHFDPMPELREQFIKQNKQHLVDKLDTLPMHVSRVFIPQGQPLGLGHAVLQAEKMIEKDEFFAVILADDFVLSKTNIMQQLIQTSADSLSASVLVERVAKHRLSSYGVIQPSQWAKNVCDVKSIVEKPNTGTAPSDFGVIGRYVLPQQIFALLKQTEQDKNKEIQLTDALKGLVEKGYLKAVALDGQRYDCGSHAGFVLANLEVAMQNSELKQDILNHIKQF